MSDTIFITGVVIHARHGVMDHETEVGQRFVIDLELSIDLSDSSRTDRLVDTVSYSSVVATATSAFKNANYKLLERAAGAVADIAPERDQYVGHVWPIFACGSRLVSISMQALMKRSCCSSPQGGVK